MEVKLQKPKRKSLECTLEITFTPNNIEQQIQQKLVEISKTAKIQGFRPGKIPMHIVEKRYGDEIKWDIIQEETQEAYRQALKQEGIVPAGVGTFEKMDYDNLEKISFTAVVEKMPDIEDIKLEKLKLKRYTPVVEDKEVDEKIVTYQGYARTWESKIVGSKAEAGDQVKIDFVGRLEDGTVFDGGSAADFEIVLGDKQMLPEFEDALYGTAEGDAKTISLTFPESYGEKTLSGKNAKFDITVKAINRAVLPALDDAEFLQNMGVKEGGAEELKSLARMECSMQLEQTLNSFNNKTVQDLLLDTYDFIIPNVLLEEEKKLLIQETQQQKAQHAGQTGADISTAEIEELSKEDEKRIEKQAYERCKLSLVYQKISQKFEIKPDTKAISMHLQQLCQQYFNGDVKQFEKSPHLPQVKRDLEQRNMMEQIHNKVYESANIKDEPTNKDALEKLSKKIFTEK